MYDFVNLALKTHKQNQHSVLNVRPCQSYTIQQNKNSVSTARRQQSYSEKGTHKLLSLTEKKNP
jgi:hypothetical protein